MRFFPVSPKLSRWVMLNKLLNISFVVARYLVRREGIMDALLYIGTVTWKLAEEDNCSSLRQWQSVQIDRFAERLRVESRRAVQNGIDEMAPSQYPNMEFPEVGSPS